MRTLSVNRHGIRSECIGCGEVFCGLLAFEAHRTGAEDVRECLTIVALDRAGWTRCELDRWQTPTGRHEDT